ncbi:non-ribosomal peptide synthetase [Actinomadura kijaniata]|uniref:non-ribosomal peptide synthetase n=1 Tax=Actinomadura kijaniata TaxID=46161 RepID=UPI0008306A2F|nr:non-ribosomal peptide synthetase [Actinomadura kijaniata]
MRVPDEQVSPSAPVSVEQVAQVVAEVLGLAVDAVDPDVRLTVLGLDSFTAVRLRRRLRDLGLDLPMTAFLGAATVRGVAAGVVDPGEVSNEEAEEQGEGAPLTPLQTAYWIGRDPAFPLGGVATFYYREYDRAPGPDGPEKDLQRLTVAWNRLVEHHPMLRMVVDGDGRQRILRRVEPYEIEVEDLRSATSEETRTRLAELRHERSHQVRDPGRWPLFDVRAAFLPGGRTRIFLGIDVLALDLAGWMQILGEWGELVADPAAELPAAPLTFAELVQRRAADPEEARRRDRDLAYWRRRAETLPSGPRLPWATDLAGLRGHRFSRWSAELTAEQWRALRDRAAERGLSPTGVLLAAFGLVLHRWGAPAPFCLNTTLFDRPDEPELTHLVGDFTSTILVEVPEPEPTGFGEFAARLNRRFWTDMEHRAVSGVEVLRDAGTTDLTPAHPVVFTSGLGLSDPERDPAAWLGEEVHGISQTPQVALDHIVHDEGGRLRVAWDAVDGAFPDGFVAGMRDAHLRLLRRLAAEPDAWDDPALGWDPSFLPDQPLDRRPFGDAGPLLDDPLRAAARDLPGNAALLGSTRGLTHGELAERTARVGAALAAGGIGPGDLVAVAFDKGIDQVVAMLGVCAGGAGYVPVEPSWPAERIASVCAQAGVTTALVPEGSNVVWPDHVDARTLPLDGAADGTSDGAASPVRPAPDDLAYVIFTSGSTGRPKGVAIEHRAARTTIDDLIDRFPVGPDDRVLGLSAFSFDLSVHDVFGVMGTGAALVLPDADRQRDPGHWLDLMERHRVTVWNTAPALMEMLVEYAEIEPERAREVLASLRLVFLSADWIPVTLPDRIRELAPGAQVVSLGGATEASIWSICHPIGEVDPAWPSIPYGRALRGQSFHILDKEGRPCPVGEPGELNIGGDGLARGYIGDDRQTCERFVFHPVLRRRLYRTGDLGRWRYDGTIEFLGRLDRQVKIRGHRIELGEVEAALDRAPGVRHAVALSVRGPDDRPRLVAYLVAADPRGRPSDDDLVDHLRARVPDFMVPSRLLWLESFPVTANGKVDYKALPNPYDRRAARAEPEPAPRPPERADPLAALLRQAAEQGLDVSLRISGGTLAPARALTAAGEWAGRLSAEAVDQGVTLHARLPADGLIELSVVTAPAPVLTPSPEPTPAETARPAPEPRDETDPEVERVVSETLSELLGGAPIDVDTPFLRLGATSLTLVRAHARLVERLDPDLSVVDLFTRPTVRRLAAWITSRRDGTRQEPDAPPEPPSELSAEGPAARRARNRRLARQRAAEVAR